MDIARRSLLALAAVAGGAAVSPRTSAHSAVAPSDPTEIIRLWPGPAPGGEGVAVTGVVTERSTDPAFHDRFAQHTTDPLMTVFRPERPNGSALLLIPGGGYRW